MNKLDLMSSLYDASFAASGFSQLKDSFINNWLGPIFILVVAAIAIKFVISRQFRELAGFLAIAAVVGLLVFAGDSIFGKSGYLSKMADGIGKGVANNSAEGTITLSGLVEFTNSAIMFFI